MTWNPDRYDNTETFIEQDSLKVRSLVHKVKADVEVLFQSDHPSLKNGRTIFGTLTYRPDQAWERQHISSFSNALKLWCQRKGFPLCCVWVVEFHKSGKPHYHYLMRVPKGITPPKPDKRGWWSHGMSNVKWASRSALGYLAKYLSKPQSKSLGESYKGMRRHGSSGLSSAELSRIRRLLRTPKWLKPYVGMDSDIVKDGSFYIDRARNNWFVSPWRFVRFSLGCMWFVMRPMWRGLIDEQGSFREWDGGERDYRLAKNQAGCCAA